MIEEADIVLCIGFFDGIHIAHQLLISETIAIAKAKRLPAAMMTFSTQVMAFIKNEQYYFLTPLEAKIAYAKQMGFDCFYVLEVDQALVNLQAEAFINRFLIKANTVVVGFDFSFGRYGLGNTESLKAHQEFVTTVIPEFTDEGEKVGSSRIRYLLSNGKILSANRLLGKTYSIDGTVIFGQGRGKTLGYPTANIDYDGFFLPHIGVYATTVIIDGIAYRSMTNVGKNPTFNGCDVTLETNVFQYDESLYGKKIGLAFEFFLRDDIKFASKTELIAQLHQDFETINRFFDEREVTHEKTR
jgi:riboflavin kinase/FMN adenylyltransferase